MESASQGSSAHSKLLGHAIQAHALLPELVDPVEVEVDSWTAPPGHASRPQGVGRISVPRFAAILIPSLESFAEALGDFTGSPTARFDLPLTLRLQLHST